MTDELRKSVDQHDKEIAQHGRDLDRLDERTHGLADNVRRLDADKLDRRELEPMTWQLRSIVLAIISVMGALVLHALTKAKL